MLAQNFKTATDLGITDAELDALIKVLGMLERGELQQYDYAGGSGLFDMTSKGSGCGTPACIGGWVAALMGKNQLSYVNSHRFEQKPLHDLYWNMEAVFHGKAQHAAYAIRSYLTTGEANWAEALMTAPQDNPNTNLS